MNRRRAVRAAAAGIAALLLTGQVMAAAGLCAMKSPTTSQSDVAATSAHCDQHVVDDLAPGSTTGAHHCPTEDASAQPRSVDIPTTPLMAPTAASLFAGGTWQPAHIEPAVASKAAVPPPLFQRPHRLQL